MILLTQFQRSWLIWNLKKKLYKPTVIFWNEKRRLIPPSIQIKPLDLSPRDHMKDWYKNDYSNHIHNCTAGRSLFMPSTKNSSRKNTVQQMSDIPVVSPFISQGPRKTTLAAFHCMKYHCSSSSYTSWS